MALYGESRRSHVTAVDGVVMYPVLVDFWNATCHKKGHIGKVCRSGPAAHQRKPQQESPKKGVKQVQAIEQGTVSDPEVEELQCSKWEELQPQAFDILCTL